MFSRYVQVGLKQKGQMKGCVNRDVTMQADYNRKMRLKAVYLHRRKQYKMFLVIFQLQTILAETQDSGYVYLSQTNYSKSQYTVKI